MNEIIIKDENNAMRECDILSVEYGFDEKIQIATNVATSLTKVIEDQKLAVNIQGNKYVTAEGWETLGTMLGCTPYVESVELVKFGDKKSDYGYEATVCIKQGDKVLSRASAMAERNNMQRERHAVYSMAQTRALGKAYRMAFSWIVKMSGYCPTPAEEMQTVNKSEAFNRAKAKTLKKNNTIDVEKVEDK